MTLEPHEPPEPTTPSDLPHLDPRPARRLDPAELRRRLDQDD